MKILLVQYRPAIRLYKWAETLSKMGHNITIARTQREVTNIPWWQLGCEMIDFRAVNPFMFNRYISFNPNIRGLSSIMHPFEVQAVGDLRSGMRDKKNAETNSFFRCRWAVFVSERQRMNAVRLFPFLRGKTKVIYNGMTDDLLPVRLRRKYGRGKINMVWHGTLCDRYENHRYLFPLFSELCKNKEIRLHIYHSALKLPDIYRTLPAVLHDTVRPEYLVSELSQYDAGLIIWQKNEKVADMSLPNKLYEYLSAGLPVIGGRYESLMKLSRQLPVFTFEHPENISVSELKRIIDDHKKRGDISGSWKRFTYGAQIDKFKHILR